MHHRMQVRPVLRRRTGRDSVRRAVRQHAELQQLVPEHGASLAGGATGARELWQHARAPPSWPWGRAKRRRRGKTTVVSLTRDGKLKLVFVYLVLSAASARAIPFLIWGADFHNLQIYQTCSHDRSAYLISGEACGDKYQRDMIYPPLMLHSFGWTRAL